MRAIWCMQREYCWWCQLLAHSPADALSPAVPERVAEARSQPPRVATLSIVGTASAKRADTALLGYTAYHRAIDALRRCFWDRDAPLTYVPAPGALLVSGWPAVKLVPASNATRRSTGRFRFIEPFGAI